MVTRGNESDIRAANYGQSVLIEFQVLGLVWLKPLHLKTKSMPPVRRWEGDWVVIFNCRDP